MRDDALFCSLTSLRIAELVRSAQRAVCYAGPGIQPEVAQAMLETGKRLGTEMLTICVDFDERVMRMGYGRIEAVKLLRDAGINVRSAPGLRTALVIADNSGFIFTPTALYLEAEPVGSAAPNAIRMSGEQMAEALARLSPAAKAIAVAQAKTPAEKNRIEALPLDVGSNQVTNSQFSKVGSSLEKAPPVRFDLARQVRVFEPFLQYVELSLTGAAIQRHRLAIPPNIQKLGGSKDLEHRLRTTFELIEKNSKLSSKPLEDALNDIRKNFTPSLGKDHGRVVLKAAKPHLVKRLDEFRAKLTSHQSAVAAELQQHLDKSRNVILDYYLPRVVETPPDALLGQLLSDKPSKDDARQWLNEELDRVFPSAESLIQEMRLEARYKDVTFETLNREDFLESVKAAFPNVDWDKAYDEFKAAGESGGKDGAG
ncbi:hypothetical protein FJZ55_09915 [Candidatus Woesearchaeota archaeon]|nr:hypothetical protein [Candidatus Woesearchaeota archaeon]